MSETSQSQVNEPVSAEELAQVITEFEQYRERLRNDTLEAAKKAKLSKKATLAQLEPELAKLDNIIEGLRNQHATLVGSN